MSYQLPQGSSSRSETLDPYSSRGTGSRTYYFTVKGRGDFPLDMLRYDRAWAVTGIEWFDGNPTKHRLVVCASHSPYSPTKDRWTSFSWPVQSERINKPGFLP